MAPQRRQYSTAFGTASAVGARSDKSITKLMKMQMKRQKTEENQQQQQS